MIPIELTIQGLYSYQKKQIIDFTKLTDAGLFGIFGGVGSGKSSIIEAITFAIYGETDRLNKRDNRNYNMMNLKSNELLIDFIFKAGKDEKTYRSTVKGRRNSKNFDDVRVITRTASKKTDDKWEVIELGELVDVISLSYNNFKRTVIIPQGQFQEFLQLGNKDRTLMMKELFNLEKYDLSNKVSILEKKNNEQKNRAEGQLMNLGDINPELIETYSNQLLKLEEEIENHNLEHKKSSELEEQLRGLKELIQKKSYAENKLTILLEQKDYFISLENRVKLYELCVNRFKNLIDRIQENNEKLVERNNDIVSDKEKLRSVHLVIERLEQFINKLKPDFEKRNDLKVKVDDLDNLLNIKKLEDAISEKTKRVEIGRSFWSDCNKEVEELKALMQTLDDKLKVLRNNMPDLSLLSAINTWHIEMLHLDKQMSELTNNINNTTKKEEDIEKERILIISNPFFETLVNEVTLKTCRDYLKLEELNIKNKQTKLLEQTTHLRVKEKLKFYAEDLKEGFPCPVCGSLHHPEPNKSEDIKDKLDDIRKESIKLEERLNIILALNKSIEKIEDNIEIILSDKIEYQSNKEKLLRLIDIHKKKFVWNKYVNKDELDNAFFEADRLKNEITNLEKKITLVSDKLALHEKKREQARERLESLRNVLTKHNTEFETLIKQLRVVTPEEYNETTIEDIEEEKHKLSSRFDFIEREYNSGIEKLIKHRNEKDKLVVKIESNEKELQNEKTTILKLENSINEELRKSDFNSLNEVERILSESIDLNTEKQRIKEYNESLLKSKTEFDQLIIEIGDKSYDSERHKELITKIDLLNIEKQEKSNEKGKITERLEDLKKKLQSQSSLRNELKELVKRADNIRTMRTLFNANGFVNYISSVYLQNLCNAANDRFFQLTRQKLSLEITSDNNFQIRDFMNSGKVRGVKTLSGGQTFQASLSLALALADNIQKTTHSNQNFFFLDEGFGTLDKESLNIVFDTLKSLRKENRIVGVISHVEEMQQEIEVHLRIENDDENGSIIYQSWNE